MPSIKQAVARNQQRMANAQPTGPEIQPTPVGFTPSPGNVPGAPAPTDPTVSSRSSMPGMIVGDAPPVVPGTPTRSRVYLPVTVGLSGSPVKAKVSPAAALGQATTNQVAIGLTPAEAAAIGLNTGAQKAAFVAAVGSVGKIKPVL